MAVYTPTPVVTGYWTPGSFGSTAPWTVRTPAGQMISKRNGGGVNPPTTRPAVGWHYGPLAGMDPARVISAVFRADLVQSGSYSNTKISVGINFRAPVPVDNNHSGSAKATSIFELPGTTASSPGFYDPVADTNRLRNFAEASGTALAAPTDLVLAIGTEPSRTLAANDELLWDLTWTVEYWDAGADATVHPWDTVNLNTGTPAGGTWTQTSGPTVTLSGSGDTRSFVAPVSLDQQVLTFTYGHTDAVKTVTIQPAQHALVGAGGVLTPARFQQL